MGLFDSIENRILQAISNLFAPVVRPLQKLWSSIKGFFEPIIELVPELIAVVELIIAEVIAWRSFRENLNFKTGVINLQSARDRIEQLFDELVQGWNSLIHLFTDGFKLSVRPFEDAADAATELADLLESFGKIGLGDFLRSIGPKIEKAGGKLLEIFAIVQAVAENALKVVRQIHDVVQALKDIRETIQTGEGLFLQQRNPRKTVKLADGGSIKLRLGNIH